MSMHEIISAAATVIEAAAVVTIVGGLVYGVVVGLIGLVQRRDGLYRGLRRHFGRGILIGLELLVAADIIRTVSEDATFESLGLLAIVIVLRTFLSFALETEIAGRAPWRRAEAPGAS
jgi:uncharacterized membrane protein